MTNRPISIRQPQPDPLNQNEHEFRRQLLIDRFGFTADEADSYMNGDRSALDAVTSRRKQAADALMARQGIADDTEFL